MLFKCSFVYSLFTGSMSVIIESGNYASPLRNACEALRSPMASDVASLLENTWHDVSELLKFWAWAGWFSRGEICDFQSTQTESGRATVARSFKTNRPYDCHGAGRTLYVKLLIRGLRPGLGGRSGSSGQDAFGHWGIWGKFVCVVTFSFYPSITTSDEFRKGRSVVTTLFVDLAASQII